MVRWLQRWCGDKPCRPYERLRPRQPGLRLVLLGAQLSSGQPQQRRAVLPQPQAWFSSCEVRPLILDPLSLGRFRAVSAARADAQRRERARCGRSRPRSASGAKRRRGEFLGPRRGSFLPAGLRGHGVARIIGAGTVTGRAAPTASTGAAAGTTRRATVERPTATTTRRPTATTTLVFVLRAHSVARSAVSTDAAAAHRL